MSDRNLIGSEISYPTPWRLAERRGSKQIVVCAAGHYVAEMPDAELAELVVRIVNEYVDRVEGRL